MEVNRHRREFRQIVFVCRDIASSNKDILQSLLVIIYLRLELILFLYVQTGSTQILTAHVWMCGPQQCFVIQDQCVPVTVTGSNGKWRETVIRCEKRCTEWDRIERWIPYGKKLRHGDYVFRSRYHQNIRSYKVDMETVGHEERTKRISAPVIFSHHYADLHGAS